MMLIYILFIELSIVLPIGLPIELPIEWPIELPIVLPIGLPMCFRPRHWLRQGKLQPFFAEAQARASFNFLGSTSHLTTIGNRSILQKAISNPSNPIGIQ